MRATWYVLEDGTPADPNEVAPDEKGVLRHASGQAVAMGPHGPRSRSMSAEEIEPARADREMKPGRGKSYKTR